MPTKLYKIIVLIMISLLLNKIMVSCKEKNRAVKMIRGSQLEINSDYKGNPEILKEIQPYHDSLKRQVSEVLCFNPKVLSREEAPLESSLGNFYADICYQAADSMLYKSKGIHIDFALFNYGGIRTAIQAGDVKVGDLFKLMPFENKLVVAELSAAQVKALFAYLAARGQAHPISGLEAQLQDGALINIKIQGKAFDPDKNYQVLTHDYLQHGGDNMSFFTQPLALFSTDYKVRDALIDHLKQIDTLHAALDNRLSYTE